MGQRQEWLAHLLTATKTYAQPTFILRSVYNRLTFSHTFFFHLPLHNKIRAVQAQEHQS